MALTASLTVSPSTVTINQPIACSLTVSNSGGAAVGLLAANPQTVVHGSSPLQSMLARAVGVIDLGPGATTSIPAAGSVTYGFSVVFFSPTESGQNFDITVQCAGADGSNFTPTAQSVTVNPISLPATEQ